MVVQCLQRLIRLAAAVLACVLGVASARTPVAADVSDSYAAFSAVREQIRGVLADRYGGTWRKDMFKDAIAAEFGWLESENGDLKNRSADLASQRFALRSDRDQLQPKIEANSSQLAAIAKKKQNIADRQAALNNDLADLASRGKRHNDNQCVYTEDNPAACAAYDAEKRSLDAELEALQGREAVLNAESQDVENQETALQGDAAALASQDHALDQRQSALKDAVDAFVARCSDSVTRARALLEIVRDPHQDVLSTDTEWQKRERKRHEADNEQFDAFAGILGSGALSGLFGALEIEAGGAGAAVLAADVVDKDMDERATEVANNTYLLGAYGAALVNLKRNGRLSPGDTGYDALRSMTNKLGAESPGSAGEFTFQSVTKTRSMIRNAVQALAVELIPTPAEKMADGFVSSIMTKQIAKSSGKTAAVAIGRGFVDKYVEGVQRDYVMKPSLKAIAESVDEQSRQAAQDALHGHGR